MAAPVRWTTGGVDADPFPPPGSPRTGTEHKHGQSGEGVATVLVLGLLIGACTGSSNQEPTDAATPPPSGGVLRLPGPAYASRVYISGPGEYRLESIDIDPGAGLDYPVVYLSSTIGCYVTWSAEVLPEEAAGAGKLKLSARLRVTEVRRPVSLPYRLGMNVGDGPHVCPFDAGFFAAQEGVAAPPRCP